jgi:hypothetical protein
MGQLTVWKIECCGLNRNPDSARWRSSVPRLWCVWRSNWRERGGFVAVSQLPWSFSFVLPWFHHCVTEWRSFAKLRSQSHVDREKYRMKYQRRFFLALYPGWLLLALLIGKMLLLPAVSSAQQPWSGIVSTARAADWTQAGLPGDVPPDASWTQCGSTVAAYGSSSSYASPTTIQNAINACGTNQYVLLGPGSFYISPNVYLKSNMVLRGSGANQTSPGAGCALRAATHGQEVAVTRASVCGIAFPRVCPVLAT